MSADGRVVVGTGDLDGDGILEAFRWTRETGAISLGHLSGYPNSFAGYVSDDGSVIVGRVQNSDYEAFRWTQQNGMVGLGPIPGLTSSRATAVSGDGSTIVGGTIGFTVGFIWKAESGMRRLEPPGFGESGAIDVSADGRVVALTAHLYDSAGQFVSRAVLWNAVDGFQEIGPPPDGWGNTSSIQISADGKELLGLVNPQTQPLTPQQAFLWSQESGFKILPRLTAGNWTFASMTPDASVVVATEIIGRLSAPDMSTLVVWDEQFGTRSLLDILRTQHGFSQADLFFNHVYQISADQKTLLVSSDFQNLSCVYLDKPLLSVVPEPCGMWLLFAGLSALGGLSPRLARRNPVAVSDPIQRQR